MPGSSFDVSFGVDPSNSIVSVYEFTIGTVTPLSPTSLSFTGNGVQDDGFGSWYGPVTGTITGSTFKFTLLEQNDTDNDPLTYTLNATGTILSNGEIVLGTWDDNYGTDRTGTFNITDVGSEVFSFTTTPTCVNVIDGGEAPKVTKFGYTIPAGAPGNLSGQPVAVRVTDGGSTGVQNDTYRHNFAQAQGTLRASDTARPTYTQYPITAGNLTVFS